MPKAAKKSEDLYTIYTETIAPQVQKELGIKNNMATPKITKITVNSGIGTFTRKQGGKDFSHIVDNIANITGQKPVIRKAKKAISNFKLRIGDPVGVSVTLRGKRMYDFLNKLINVVFPRVRDFRGISAKSFNGTGNISIGFKEHIAFPEISPDDVMNIHGLQVNINTNSKDDETAKTLLKAFGFPLKKS